jgi:hypothetical protein
MIRQLSLVEPLSIYNFKFIFDHLVGRVYQNYMSNVNQNPTLTLIQKVATFLKQCGQEFINVGRILASIGGTLFAAGGVLSLIF